MSKHLTREWLVANLAAPAIVSALSIGRIPPRVRGLPRILLLPRVRTRDAFSNALLYRMPAGIPGDVNRAWAPATIEPNVLDANYPFLAFGLACVMDQTDFQIRPAGGSTGTNKNDAAAVLYGLLVRPFPVNQQTTNQFFGQNPLSATQPAPPTSGLCDILKSGYITVALQGATAAVAGGPVFVLANGANANTTTALCGGIHAAADAGCVQAGNAGNTYFRGAADSNGNVEIAWNL